MSWERTKATGFGTLAWRVMIEGFPFEAVSHKGMEQSLSDGRERKVGLKSDGLRFSERIDLATTTWEGQGLTIEVADVGNVWTEAFAKIPQSVTYLDGDITASATTITVKSTTAFPSSGTIHIGQEAIRYTGKGATSFTGCTRGSWDSFARAHYTADGERLAYPEVTEIPVSLAGRRVYVYVYGAGDDKQGDGTLVWTGVARTDPRGNGVSYSFSVDPISSLFDADLGSDLKDPAPLRGIYYSEHTPFAMIIAETVGRRWGDDPAAATSFALAGFWESQEAFCEAVTTAIAAALADTDYGTFTQTDVTCVPDGDAWAIRFVTHSTTPVSMQFYGPGGANTPVSSVDGPMMHAYFKDVADGRADSVVSLTGGRTYLVPIVGSTPDQAGTVPRMAFSSRADDVRTAIETYGVREARRTDLDASTNPFDRFHVGGGADIDASVTQIILEWEANGGGAEWSWGPFPVDSVSASSRYVQGDQRWAGLGRYTVATSANVPTARLGRDYGTGSLGTFLQSIVDNAADYVGTGSVPDLRPTDFTNNGADIAGDTAIGAAASTRYLSQRRYTVFSEVKLRELIEHECRLLGVYPALDASGKITFRKLRLPSATDVAGDALTKSEIVVSNGFYTWERNGMGTVSTVIVETGYDPLEDAYVGDRFKIRDVSAHGRAGSTARTVQIAPKSVDPDGPISLDDQLGIGGRVFGIFGGDYVVLSIELSLRNFDIQLGDVVALTWSKVPNDLGALGVEGKVGLVLARDWDLMEGVGQVTLLLSSQHIGGYAPSSTLSGIVGTSGTTGPFSANMSATYFPSGTNAASYFEAGDKVRLFRRDSTSTAQNVTATVDSVVANSITFTTDSNWAHGSSSNWVLGFQLSTAITADGQKRYVYIANADATLDFSGDTGNAPFTLAP